MFHAGMLGGPHYRMSCQACGRFVYLRRDARNVLLPLLMLGAAFIVGFPSPISAHILSSAGSWLPIVRAEIWAITTLIAFAIFAFAGKLAVSDPQPHLRISVNGRITNLAIQFAMLAWLYFVLHDLMNMG